MFDYPEKPLEFVASRDDLSAMPQEVKNVFGQALWEAQNGGKHVDAKPLKGFGGAGVLEVVGDHRGNAYRAVYTVIQEGGVRVARLSEEVEARDCNAARRHREDQEQAKACRGSLCQALRKRRKRKRKRPRRR